MALADEIQERRIFGGSADVIKLHPIKYQFAMDAYRTGNANHWLPQEIQMQKDIEQWPKLTDGERHVVETALGFFTTADSLVANNLVLGVYKHLSAPECRMYLLRQAFEEAVHCYEEGAEILTENGFVDFRDLEQEKVAQYHADGTISWVLPHVYLCDDFQGNLVRFQNEYSYSLSVTPNHRCVVLEEREDNELRIIEAESLSPSNRRFPVSGVLQGDRKLTDFERLQIAYQADGCLLNKGFNNGAITGKIGYLFSFKKTRKINRLRALLDRLGMDYTETPRNERGYIKFYVRVPKETPLYKTFDWFRLSEISGVWASEFIDELQYWDGSTRDKGIVYTTSNKVNAEMVTLLAHLCGKRAGVYTSEAEGMRREHYQVYFSNKGYVSGKTIEKSETPYSGKVYCVGVQTGMLVIRQNGKIMVSGNTESYQHIVQSLGLDEEVIFQKYKDIEEIYNKDGFVTKVSNRVQEATIDIYQFAEIIFDFYIIMEGIFFYSSFAAIMGFRRRNLLPGTAEQFQYIMRDEAMHLQFGTNLLNALVQENPRLDLLKNFKYKVKKAVELEQEYARTMLDQGLLGISTETYCQYVEFIADRRLQSIGLNPRYNAVNPFPWMSEITDLTKQKNFFETRVTEYQQGALKW